MNWTHIIYKAKCRHIKQKRRQTLGMDTKTPKSMLNYLNAATFRPLAATKGGAQAVPTVSSYVRPFVRLVCCPANINFRVL